MKKKLAILISLIIIVLFLSWFFYPIRSLLVMSVYSADQDKQSVMKQNGFEIDIPSGRGWYPFVMTYNANGFDTYSGLDAQMSIMYNFGTFDVLTRTSALYDTGSDKYSSFYGAYVVKENGGVFAFDEHENLDIGELSLAVKYDYTKLVIEDFGCDKLVFSLDGYETQSGVAFAGTDGWVRVDASLTVNGAAHNYDGYKTPYLQYGRPVMKYESDFETIQMYGRVYAKYFEEYGCTIMVYVIAPSVKTIDTCDLNILSKTHIGHLNN